MNRLAITLLPGIIACLVACAGNAPDIPAIPTPPAQAIGQTEAMGEHPELGLRLILTPETTTVRTAGEELRVRLEVQNLSQATQSLQFRSGQTFDLALRDAMGHEMARWSDGRFFTQALQRITLRPGETLVNHLLLALPPQHTPLPTGTYQIIGELATTPPLATEPMTILYAPEVQP